ncbi:hypothetical protein V490_04367 [Pseudogymnoascus sp. VKM F-3557]|nr:hypothetical protein V490_04367 [Pseudogymnoascus sp. VKM F-3557]
MQLYCASLPPPPLLLITIPLTGTRATDLNHRNPTLNPVPIVFQPTLWSSPSHIQRPPRVDPAIHEYRIHHHPKRHEAKHPIPDAEIVVAMEVMICHHCQVAVEEDPRCQPETRKHHNVRDDNERGEETNDTSSQDHSLTIIVQARVEDLPAHYDAPEARVGSPEELHGEEGDDEAFAPWRVDARRAGDLGHSGHVGLEVGVGEVLTCIGGVVEVIYVGGWCLRDVVVIKYVSVRSDRYTTTSHRAEPGQAAMSWAKKLGEGCAKCDSGCHPTVTATELFKLEAATSNAPQKSTSPTLID